MYKKFVINMIRRAIENEFSFRIKICDITVIDYDETLESFFFKFTSIFVNTTVYGLLDCYGNATFDNTSIEYRVLQNYYNGDNEDC